MRISDWSSDVCSSDLQYVLLHQGAYVGPWWRVATQAGEKNALHAIRQPEIAILFQVQEDHATVNLAVRHIVAQLVRHGVFLEAKGAPFGAPPCSLLRRSEEHTSELQSLMRISYAVFCLKKKKTKNT